ncbi:MAG: DUF1080 domain-containing protein [Chitinophagaceae bacterium]
MFLKNCLPASILVFALLLIFESFSIKSYQQSLSPTDSLKISLPKQGRLINGKPVGKGWVNLLSSIDGWNIDSNYKVKNAVLHAEYYGGQLHDYAWTKKIYKDFELHALVKLDGKDANSGVCIRLNPVNADNAPGYQVDMGIGYWGCLWEEKRAGMVQKFPDSLAAKLVKNQDWNHYYIIAKGHHIQAWLNGVKTIDIVHNEGFSEGAIGFQLCHGDKHTILDAKSLYIKEL